MIALKVALGMILGITIGIPGLVLGVLYLLTSMIKPVLERLLTLTILLAPSALAVWICYGTLVLHWSPWLAVAAAGMLITQGIVMETIRGHRAIDP